MQLQLKNAYLIIAHDNWEQVELMIRLLDCKYNDIFIHVNSMAEMPNQQKLQKCANSSKVVFSDRTKIVWGEYGIFDAAMLLLKKARNTGDYDYYHLLTGSCLPLKSNDDIQVFLQRNMYNNPNLNHLKTNYIGVGYSDNPKMYARITQYNLFVPWWKNQYYIIEFFARKMNRLGYYIQKILRVNRLKDANVKLAHGSSWWMISNELAEYVILNESWIERYFFKYTFSADEFIIQTLAMNSTFKDSMYIPEERKNGEANMWEIDWNRGDGEGSPHIFTSEDINMLLLSPNIYGRKFDIRVDREVVNAIVKNIRPEILKAGTKEV